MGGLFLRNRLGSGLIARRGERSRLRHRLIRCGIGLGESQFRRQTGFIDFYRRHQDFHRPYKEDDLMKGIWQGPEEKQVQAERDHDRNGR